MNNYITLCFTLRMCMSSIDISYIDSTHMYIDVYGMSVTSGWIYELYNCVKFVRYIILLHGV